MGLRRWKAKFAKGVGVVTDTVSGAVDTAKAKAGEILDTSLTFEKAQETLADELEKGVQIFDEIGLPQQVGDDIQEEIAEFAMNKLELAWKHPERKSE